MISNLVGQVLKGLERRVVEVLLISLEVFTYNGMSSRLALYISSARRL